MGHVGPSHNGASDSTGIYLDYDNMARPQHVKVSKQSRPHAFKYARGHNNNDNNRDGLPPSGTSEFRRDWVDHKLSHAHTHTPTRTNPTRPRTALRSTLTFWDIYYFRRFPAIPSVDPHPSSRTCQENHIHNKQ